MDEFEFREELERAISSAGISELFNRDRLVRRVVEHFEKAGKLKELKEFVKQQEKRPDFQLKDLISIGEFEIPFYELLEEEGITFDPENFLRLNGERVAYVGREIIPLKEKNTSWKKF